MVGVDGGAVKESAVARNGTGGGGGSVRSGLSAVRLEERVRAGEKGIIPRQERGRKGANNRIADLLPEMDSCRMEKRELQTANGKDAERREGKGKAV